MKVKKGILAFIILAFALTVAGPIFAQEAAQEKAAAQPQLRKEVVILKYLKAEKVQNFIYTFLRPGYGRVTPGPTEGSLVISDSSENVEQALQALKKIDVKPADLQFTVQLVLGSESGELAGPSMTDDPVIRELKNLLRYKSYALLDTSVIRTMDFADSQVRIGEKADFEFWIRPKVVKDEKTSSIQMEIRLRQDKPVPVFVPNAASGMPPVNQNVPQTLISTTLSIKSGDKTVVGVSKLDGGDKGLILIISGKVVD